MNRKLCFVLIVSAFWLHTASGGTNEQLVTNTAANTELHAIENTWNKVYNNTSSDFTGTLAGFSQSGTSANGTITVTLKVSNITYSLDLGALNFDPLSPIDDTTCEYTETVNNFEAVGSGSVTVKTPAGQFSYQCSSVKMGLKSFVLNGNVTVVSTGLAFSNGVAVIDSSDYYFAYNCSRTSAFAMQYLSETNTLPAQYRTILSAALRKPGSNFTHKAIGTTRTKMKNGMVQIHNN